MLQIIKTNIYRTISNRRLLKVLFIYLLIFLSLVVTSTILSEVGNNSTDPGFCYEYELFRELWSDRFDLWDFALTGDFVLMGTIFQFFWLSDYARDNCYRTMCSISRSRWRIILSNYISMFLMTPVLMMIKLVLLAITAAIFRYDMTSWSLTPQTGLKILIMILLVGTHEAFYYFLYVATGSFMAMIYAFFIPFTVSISSGMFSCMPYGEQIANVVLVLFFAPNVLYELVSSGKLFEGRLWTCLPLFAAIIAVLLFLACLIAEKRDVR